MALPTDGSGIVESVFDASTIKSLNLSKRLSSSFTLSYLPAVIELFKEVELLNFSGTDITPTQVQYIVSQLENLNSIKLNDCKKITKEIISGLKVSKPVIIHVDREQILFNSES